MNARDEALRILLRAGLPGWDAPRLQTLRLRDRKGDDSRDIGLGLAISRAVTRNMLLLQHLVAHYSGRQLRQVDPLVQMVLAIGLAQLRFFQRLPGYAVVDEAVEQAKSLRLGKASGFINAILRRALREPDVALPDASDAQAYAHMVLSHPPLLFQRMSRLMGVEAALMLARRHNEEPPLILRQIAPEMPPPPEGVSLARHERDRMWVVEGATEAMLAEWSAAGIAQAQDPTSARIVDQLWQGDAPAGWTGRVCDRCCGVGTKTLQIAESAPAADILAIDPAKHRIRILERTLARRGISNVRPQVGGMVPEAEALFDRILVDAPCSNSGVLMRRPEAKYRQTEASLRSVEALQREILENSVPQLKPGGWLVYSTCSIWPEENEEQVRWLTTRYPGLSVVEMETTLPSLETNPTRHHDGGFYAVVQKAAS